MKSPLTYLTILVPICLAKASDQLVTSQKPMEMPPKATLERTLSLSQALSMGLSRNPISLAADSQVESAHQNYNSQRSPINPTIGYAALNNTVAPAAWTSGFSQGSNYSIYATIETNGALHYRTQQAREQFHQAEFDAHTSKLSLRLSIIQAYVSLQVTKRALDVEQKVYANLVQLDELTQKRFEVGAGTQADATRAHIAAIQESQNLIADISAVQQARATLNNTLGLPQDEPVDVSEPLEYHRVQIGSLTELTKIAEQCRPELQSARSNLKALQAVPGLERSAFYPNLIAGMDLGGDGLYLGLSLPIDLGGIRGAINKAKADIKAQIAQVDTERQAIDLDVRSSLESFLQCQKQIDTYDTGILKMSEKLVDQVRHGYELGANTIVDVITAENTYRSVEGAYYAALGNYIQSVFALEHSVGGLESSTSTQDLPKELPGVPVTHPINISGKEVHS